MKKSVFLLSILVVVLAGCGRKAPLDVPPPPADQDLIGQSAP